MRVDVVSKLGVEVSDGPIEVVSVKLTLAKFVSPLGEQGPIFVRDSEEMGDNRRRDRQQHSLIQID
jgi:hypothetical protein